MLIVSNPKLVLGIETSFDDTGVALYDKQFGLLVQTISSYQKDQSHYGGIVPLLAATKHLQQLRTSLSKTIHQNLLANLSVVAFTGGPGLEKTLMVGQITIMLVSSLLDVNFVGTNHLQSHVFSPKMNETTITFSSVTLIVTGGTCSMFYVINAGCSLVLLSAADGSVGELFDKIARSLLESSTLPGGLFLTRISSSKKIRTIDVNTKSRTQSLSSSGTKTLALVNISKIQQKTLVLRSVDTNNARTCLAKIIIAGTIRTLTGRIRATANYVGFQDYAIVGGVSSSAVITQGHYQKLRLFFLLTSPRSIRTDNGAMVACLGSLHWRRNRSVETND